MLEGVSASSQIDGKLFRVVPHRKALYKIHSSEAHKQCCLLTYAGLSRGHGGMGREKFFHLSGMAARGKCNKSSVGRD